MTVTTSPLIGESTKYAVKPLRRGCRCVHRSPVCSCAHFFALLAHETAGAARTRHSLRPCVRKICQNVRTGGWSEPPVAGTEPVAPKGDGACSRARDSSG